MYDGFLVAVINDQGDASTCIRIKLSIHSSPWFYSPVRLSNFYTFMIEKCDTTTAVYIAVFICFHTHAMKHETWQGKYKG